MEFIPKSRILEFNENQVKLIRKQYKLDKPGDMSGAIDVLEEWIRTQKHFVKKELPRNLLEKAIIAAKGSLERVKQRLDKICTFRTMMPDFFGENLTKNKFEDLSDTKCCLLPKPTVENYRVFLMQPLGSNFTSKTLLTLYRYVVLLCEHNMALDYCDGIIIVIDYTVTNVSAVIKAINITELRQIVTIVTQGFGIRLKGIHLVTPSKVIDTLVGIGKQLVSSKIGNRICVHDDISTIYQYVPKDSFPIEYGGKEKSLKALVDALMDELTGNDFMTYIKEINNAKTDESCRQRDKFNEDYLGMPGSFRTLNVD